MGTWTKGHVRLGLFFLIFFLATPCLFSGCRESSESIELIGIFSDRIWFRVGEYEAGFLTSAELKSTRVYTWTAAQGLVEIEAARGNCVHYPSTDCMLGPLGERFWMIDVEGRLRLWEAGNPELTTVAERVSDWDAELSSDGLRIWFLQRDESDTRSDLYTWHVGDAEPGLVAVVLAGRLRLPGGGDRIYFFRDDTDDRQRRTLKTYALGDDEDVLDIAPKVYAPVYPCEDPERVWFFSEVGLEVWDAQGAERVLVAQGTESGPLLVSADCQRVYFLENGYPLSWHFDVRELQSVTLPAQPEQGTCEELLALSDDGSILWYVEPDGPWNKSLQVWRLVDGLQERIVSGLVEDGFALSEGGRRALFVHEDAGGKSLDCWSPDEGLLQIAGSSSIVLYHARADEVFYGSLALDSNAFTLYRRVLGEQRSEALDGPMSSFFLRPDGRKAFYYRLPQDPQADEGWELTERFVVELDLESGAKTEVGRGWIKEPVSDEGMVFQGSDGSMFLWRDGSATKLGAF